MIMMMNMMIERDDDSGILNSDKHHDDSNVVVNVDYDSDSCYGCLYNHYALVSSSLLSCLSSSSSCLSCLSSCLPSSLFIVVYRMGMRGSILEVVRSMRAWDMALGT